MARFEASSKPSVTHTLLQSTRFPKSIKDYQPMFPLLTKLSFRCDSRFFHLNIRPFVPLMASHSSQTVKESRRAALGLLSKSKNVSLAEWLLNKFKKIKIKKNQLVLTRCISYKKKAKTVQQWVFQVLSSHVLLQAHGRSFVGKL